MARATDAKETMDKLRILLANRDTEPEEYRSMQCQRWLAERRHLAAERLVTALHQHLTSPQRPVTPPTTSEPPRNEKQGDNLNRFLRGPSSGQVYRPSWKRHRAPLPPKDEDAEEDPYAVPAVHKHRKLVPLILSERKAEPSWLRQSQQRPKPKATSGPSRRPPPVLLVPPLLDAPQPRFMFVPPPKTPAGDSAGVAIIWREPKSSSSPTKPAFEEPVQMPDYARQLIADFDANSRNGRESIDIRRDWVFPVTPAPRPPPRPILEPIIVPPSPTKSTAQTPSPSKRTSAIFKLAASPQKLRKAKPDAKGKGKADALLGIEEAPIVPPAPGQPSPPKLSHKPSFSRHSLTAPLSSLRRSTSNRRLSALFSLENISYKLNHGIDVVRSKRFSVTPEVSAGGESDDSADGSEGLADFTVSSQDPFSPNTALPPPLPAGIPKLPASSKRFSTPVPKSAPSTISPSSGVPNCFGLTSGTSSSGAGTATRSGPFVTIPSSVQSKIPKRFSTPPASTHSGVTIVPIPPPSAFSRFSMNVEAKMSKSSALAASSSIVSIKDEDDMVVVEMEKRPVSKVKKQRFSVLGRRKNE